MGPEKHSPSAHLYRRDSTIAYKHRQKEGVEKVSYVTLNEVKGLAWYAVYTTLDASLTLSMTNVILSSGFFGTLVKRRVSKNSAQTDNLARTKLLF